MALGAAALLNLGLGLALGEASLLGISGISAALAGWALVCERAASRYSPGRVTALLSAGGVAALLVALSLIPRSAPIGALTAVILVFLAVAYLGPRALRTYSVRCGYSGWPSSSRGSSS
ncbi:hypothetical protein BH23CHL8_BH23CHL8_27810 [soil metagenome]